MLSDKAKDQLTTVSEALYHASQKVRILSSITWAPEVRQTFWKHGGRKLPEVEYTAFDATEILGSIDDACRKLGDSEIERWLKHQAGDIATSARMLAAIGTADFFRYSCDLYGAPKDVLPDGTTTSLALAQQFDRTIATLANVDLGGSKNAVVNAETVAAYIEKAARKMFGSEAPRVEVVEELSANALAGPERIRVRRGAVFSDKDAEQLIQHEAFVHVATSINGIGQKHLRVLGVPHPGTIKTQEGLAVFAELITGTMDLERLRRLADRAIAIQMAIDGADFIQVYQYFLERTDNPEQAFENARRVFRGGVLTGRAPFTKDTVYLDGLLRVHNFLRVIVSTGRAACLKLLFCGKLDIEDIPILYELSQEGMCLPARYLPPWISDMRFLMSYLAYSSFLNGVDLNRLKNHYDAMLANVPRNE